MEKEREEQARRQHMELERQRRLALEQERERQRQVLLREAEEKERERRIMEDRARKRCQELLGQCQVERGLILRLQSRKNEIEKELNSWVSGRSLRLSILR